MRVTIAWCAVLISACAPGSTTGPDMGMDLGATTDGASGNTDGAAADAASTDAAADGGIGAGMFGLVELTESAVGFNPTTTYSIRGVFASASEAVAMIGATTPVPGVPECFDLAEGTLPPSAVDAGVLTVDGIVGGPVTLLQGLFGEYSQIVADLYFAPFSPISIDISGSASFAPLSGTVATPHPVVPGMVETIPAGTQVTWLAGNGDYIRLRFLTPSGVRGCDVADDGAFVIPSEVTDPWPGPGSLIRVMRIIETEVDSPSTPADSLRIRVVRDADLF